MKYSGNGEILRESREVVQQSMNTEFGATMQQCNKEWARSGYILAIWYRCRGVDYWILDMGDW